MGMVLEMDCTENVFWPDEPFVLKRDRDAPPPETSIIPLLDQAAHLNIKQILDYLYKGYGSFKLLDGFSLESNFTMESRTNTDGTKVRFICEVGRGSATRYRGTVFLNTNGGIQYRRTPKSPNTQYSHDVLGRFFSSLNRGITPQIGFLPYS